MKPFVLYEVGGVQGDIISDDTMARSSALQFQLIQPLVEGLPGDPDGGANAYTLEVPFLD